VNGPKVFTHAFGCQMNKLDAELALAELRHAGYTECATPEEADVILYHTCSVRKHAEDRVYSNVGKLKHLKRRKPHVIIGILGCMAQKDREKIFARLPHVDLVCGTKEFSYIVDLVDEARRTGHVLACDEHKPTVIERDVTCRPNRFQAYVSIMRGCDNYCAYCVVPYVRGRETSRPLKEVIDEVRRLVDDGCRGITLLGQNVTSYGKSFGKPCALAELLGRLDRISGLDRVRFITSHPGDTSRAVLEAVRDHPSACEYLHMPAQSGSDRILKAMNRKYTADEYRDRVCVARDLVPGIAVASDFIVGFPDETDEDFQRTAALVRDLRFQNSFVFKYSPRPGTRAARLTDDVPWEEKKWRNVALLDIQAAVNLEENRRFVGREVEVLVEGTSKRDPRRLTGRLRTNHIVVFEGSPELAGQLIKVRVTDATALTLAGDRV